MAGRRPARSTRGVPGRRRAFRWRGVAAAVWTAAALLWVGAVPVLRAQVAGPAPTPPASAADLPSGFGDFLDWIDSKIPDGDTGAASARLQNFFRTVLTQYWVWSYKLRTVLETQARPVATALLLPVVTAEVVFAGVRLMLRASVVEQISRLTLTTIILGLLLMPRGPVDVIAAAMRRLQLAGKAVGQEILRQGTSPAAVAAMNAGPDGGEGGGSHRWSAVVGAVVPAAPADDLTREDFTRAPDLGPVELEPIYYWTVWIGFPPSKAQLRAMRSQIQGGGYRPSGDQAQLGYKFSVPSLLLRIWSDDTQFTKDGPAPAADPGGQGPASGYFTADDMADGVLRAVTPVQSIANAVVVGTIQVSGLVAVVFGAMGVLIGSITAFNVVCGLGVATLPLIYFESFKRLWAEYLVVLTGLALVPFFYYVFSAIGFVFAANLFEIFFPLPGATAPGAGGGTVSLGHLVNHLFMTSLYAALSSTLYFNNGVGRALVNAIFYLGQATQFYGKLTLGSGIVTTFIGGGVSFATLAPTVAMRWHRGFGSEVLMQRVSVLFEGLQGLIARGTASAFAGGWETLGGLGQLGGGLLAGGRSRVPAAGR